LTTRADARPAAARRRITLAVAAALVALSAVGGAIGLVSGALSIGGQLEGRLPFDSPVLAGVALVVVVAVPFAVLAVAAWRGSHRTDLVACAAGVLLLGWLVVELVIIRELSFFQPFYAAIAAGFLWVGRAALPTSRR
jgi:hypothetical protein